MTDRVKSKRRYTVHVPQLVGRVSYPQAPGAVAEDDPSAVRRDLQAQMRRIVAEYDTAMAELQNFLKYLQNASDESVTAGAFYELDPELVSAGAADPGDPTLGWAPGDHTHQALVGSPAGLGNANADGVSDGLSRADHVHKRDVRVRANAVEIGTRNALHFSSDFAVVDDAGNDEVDVALAAPVGPAVEEALAFAFLGY